MRVFNLGPRYTLRVVHPRAVVVWLGHCSYTLRHRGGTLSSFIDKVLIPQKIRTVVQIELDAIKASGWEDIGQGFPGAGETPVSPLAFLRPTPVMPLRPLEVNFKGPSFREGDITQAVRLDTRVRAESWSWHDTSGLSLSSRSW